MTWLIGDWDSGSNFRHTTNVIQRKLLNLLGWAMVPGSFLLKVTEQGIKMV